VGSSVRLVATFIGNYVYVIHVKLSVLFWVAVSCGIVGRYQSGSPIGMAHF
jgi:hypothetical protein